MSEIDIPTVAQNAFGAFERGGVQELNDCLAIVHTMYDVDLSEELTLELGKIGLFKAMAVAAVEAFEAKKPRQVWRLIEVAKILDPRFESFDKILADEFAARAKQASSQRQSWRLRDGAFTFLPRGLVLKAFGAHTRLDGEFRREWATA